MKQRSREPLWERLPVILYFVVTWVILLVLVIPGLLLVLLP